MVFWKSKDSPIPETKVLGLAVLLYSLYLLIGYLPSTILYETDKIDPLGGHFNRLSLPIVMTALFGLTITLILPAFKEDYRSIALVFLVTAVNAASAVINLVTLTHTINGDFIRIHLDPIFP